MAFGVRVGQTGEVVCVEQVVVVGGKGEGALGELVHERHVHERQRGADRQQLRRRGGREESVVVRRHRERADAVDVGPVLLDADRERVRERDGGRMPRRERPAQRRVDLGAERLRRVHRLDTAVGASPRHEPDDDLIEVLGMLLAARRG